MNTEAVRRAVAEIAYQRARFYHRIQSQPRLVVLYVNQRSETRSLRGMVIEQARLMVGTNDLRFPLGIKALALIDVLVRYKPSSLSAAQIERILKTDLTCRRLGAQRLMNRRLLKVYIHRIRMQLARTLSEIDITIEPKRLIVSENTELANAMAYRLAIPCQILYRDLDADEIKNARSCAP